MKKQPSMLKKQHTFSTKGAGEEKAKELAQAKGNSDINLKRCAEITSEGTAHMGTAASSGMRGVIRQGGQR